MKKYLFLLALPLVACMQSAKTETGLVKLDKEPTNCEFLYEINSSFSGYSLESAYDFVEKRIVDENGFGDSYYISGQDIVEIPGAIFGPHNTYNLKAKVYNCRK